MDAFGQCISLASGRKARSLMAQQVQSFELKLMLSIFPLFRDEKDAHIVSWLHDGLTVWFTDKHEQEQLIRRIKSTFDSQCQAMRIMTEMEANQL